MINHLSAYKFFSCTRLIPFQTNGIFHKAIQLSKSYTMGCRPVRGDNTQALASGLSYVQVDKHVIAPDKDWRQLGIYPPLFGLIVYFKF